MTHHDRDDVLPPGFAARLARLIEPGDADPAAAVLREAAGLDEAALTAFLTRVTARIRASPELLTARELRSFLREG